MINNIVNTMYIKDYSKERARFPDMNYVQYAYLPVHRVLLKLAGRPIAIQLPPVNHWSCFITFITYIGLLARLIVYTFRHLQFIIFRLKRIRPPFAALTTDKPISEIDTVSAQAFDAVASFKFSVKVGKSFDQPTYLNKKIDRYAR